MRGRFTIWLDRLLHNAKIDYIRKLERQIETVSIDEISENSLTSTEHYFSLDKTAFDFEEKRLADAFEKLPLMRQRILTMLFVEDKNPDEIAKQLNCSVQHVYNQRSLAIKKLRKTLENGGENQ